MNNENFFAYSFKLLTHLINYKCLFKSVTMGYTIQFTMGNGQVDDT